MPPMGVPQMGSGDMVDKNSSVAVAAARSPEGAAKTERFAASDLTHECCAGGSCKHDAGNRERRERKAKLTDILTTLKKACDSGDAKTLTGVILENPELDLGLMEDEGEMPSPLLNLAAENGYCEFVEVLIDDGEVEVDSLGEFGTTALFDACYFDNRDVAVALLDRGARADFQDPDGSTPLYAAAFQGNASCLELM
ncbi:ankyrin repeat-containing domain protein, partial [Baffinella frigidus]